MTLLKFHQWSDAEDEETRQLENFRLTATSRSCCRHTSPGTYQVVTEFPRLQGFQNQRDDVRSSTWRYRSAKALQSIPENVSVKDKI